MKYLKKSAEVLIGKAGSQNEQKLSTYGLTDHTAMLTFVTHYSDGSGEQLSGICVTREHLEQMRKAIGDYLSRTDNNTPIPEKVGVVNNFNIKAETGLTEAQILSVFGQVSQQVEQMLQTGNQQKQTHDANEPENSKQTNETGDKDVTQLKLNPNRVMSIKVGPEKWEARTRVFNGINPGLTDLVTTGISEEEAREELDKKFSDFAGPMTNFIKFMSQAS